jgi:hypothetical protein
MRYWAYINNEVRGPFEKDKLAGLPAFSRASLICPEAQAGKQGNDWKEAGSFPEVLAALEPAAAPAQSPKPAAESPLLMTMRGTLIEEPEAAAPAAQAAPAPAPRAQPAESPLAMTMRGTLIEGAVVPEPTPARPERTAAPVMPSGPAAPAPAQTDDKQQLEALRARLEQIGAMLVSIGNSQSQVLDRLGRLEGAVTDMKALLAPVPPKI